ncbi:hypothetical protein TcYC6_0009280 [Trypanosoma cruzi]|nr:hypothetical protein TcYC6_0009280 [Trypanosoma cruzi]
MSDGVVLDGTTLCAVACGLTSLDMIPLLCGRTADGQTEDAPPPPPRSITEAHLSFNAIDSRSLCRLSHLAATLQTLVLDNNELQEVSSLPPLPGLQRLWLNNNRLVGLEDVLTVVSMQCPALTYLSLLRNPCCPSELDGHLPIEYTRYRLYVKYVLPKLAHLDTDSFTQAEANEAKKKGKFARPARVKTDSGAAEKRPITVRVNNNRHTEQSGNNSVEREDLFASFDARRHEGAGAVTYLSEHRTVYVGRRSEGNRFICDDML